MPFRKRMAWIGMVGGAISPYGEPLDQHRPSITHMQRYRTQRHPSTREWEAVLVNQ